MHAICTRENLQNALFALERVVGKQSSLPILSNILLETEKGQLKLSATNLEIGVMVFIGAKIEKEGRVTIPAKLISTFIQNLPEGGVVDLQEENFHLLLKSDRHQVRIKGLDGKDFPIIPQFQGEYQLTLPTQTVKEALQKILFCVSLNESRVELTGVNLLFSSHTIAFAATDSFRLGEYQLTLNKETLTEKYRVFAEKNQNLLIPSATLQELIRVIDGEVEEIAITISENQLFIRVGQVLIVSRLINGRFPDYQQIIPKNFQEKLLLKKEDLLRALKISTSFSLYNSGEVKLNFQKEKNELSVTAESEEVGKNETTLDFEGDLSENMTIIFNPRYILEGLGAIEGEKIQFLFNTATTPTLFQGEGDSLAYRYIVMPIKK